MYLIERDFNKIFHTDDINTVLSDEVATPTEILNESIDYAIEYVKSKIQNRYDPDQIFIDVNTFDISADYAVNDLVIYMEPAYLGSKVYLTGERTSYENKIYEAKQTSQGNLPTETDYFKVIADTYSFYYCIKAGKGNNPDNTEYFTAGDSRNKLIKNYCLYLALENMMPHINPRTIPDWIVDKKNAAETHLNRINSGQDTVILPLYADENGDDDNARGHFSYGTETKRNLDY